MNNQIIGVFQRELKNRFLCEIDINGKTETCYVPSSCHLSNFLSLQGKRVLITTNLGKKTRTRFSLFAYPYKRSYILLSPAIANKAVVSTITSKRFSFLGNRKQWYAEQVIDGYKADIYIKDTDTIVEVKAVISTQDEAVFPTVYSERTLNQLSFLKERLLDGKRVCLLIVSLNPYTKGITINEASELAPILKNCIEAGLVMKAFSCRLRDNEVFIWKSLPISWSNSTIVINEKS